jgi:hypothetical protein
MLARDLARLFDAIVGSRDIRMLAEKCLDGVIRLK